MTDMDNAIEQMKIYGSCIPAITKVIYSLKKDEDRAVRDADGGLVIDETTGKPKREKIQLESPVLTTTVFWDDGTKTIVKNNSHDPVHLTEDGCADDCSKEIGLLYALWKKLWTPVDSVAYNFMPAPNAVMKRFIAKSIDQEKEAAALAAKRAATKKAAAEREAAQVANKKPKSPSIREVLSELKTLIDNFPTAITK